MRALLVSAGVLLTSCTTMNSSAERDKVGTYAHNCATAVMALVLIRQTDADKFIAPDASCTGSFLGDYARPAVDFLKSTAITAAANPASYTITLISVTDHKYTLTVTDGLESFKAN